MSDETPPVSIGPAKRRPPGAGSGAHRLNINIAASTYEELQEVSADLGVGIREVLRRGARLMELFERFRAGGEEMQLFDPATNRFRVVEQL